MNKQNNTSVVNNNKFFDNQISIWTVDDVAKQLNFSSGYIRNLVSTNKIPHRKQGKRGGKGAVRFIPSEIIDWVNQWEE